MSDDLLSNPPENTFCPAQTMKNFVSELGMSHYRFYISSSNRSEHANVNFIVCLQIGFLVSAL